MKENIIINQLPSRTWNRLGVNETALPWNIAETTDLGSDTVTAPQAAAAIAAIHVFMFITFCLSPFLPMFPPWRLFYGTDGPVPTW